MNVYQNVHRLIVIIQQYVIEFKIHKNETVADNVHI